MIATLPATTAPNPHAKRSGNLTHSASGTNVIAEIMTPATASAAHTHQASFITVLFLDQKLRRIHQRPQQVLKRLAAVLGFGDVLEAGFYLARLRLTR